MKCPYCKKKHCVPDQVLLHCENYDGHGGKTFCRHCDKPIEVECSREVVIHSIDKSDHKEGDWG